MMKKLMCKIFGHKWEKIVRPPIMSNRKKCKRCGIISY